MGISRSSFKRMILKASKIGIFTVYETACKNGSQSSNNELQMAVNFQNKTRIFSETNMKKNNKREAPHAKTHEPQADIKVSEKAPEDRLFVSDRIPSAFVNLVKYFFPTEKVIEEFWRMSRIAAY